MMYRRILVPLDGSSLAEAVLPYVTSLGLALGAEVQLLRVTHPSAAFLNDDESYVSADIYQLLLDADEQVASEYLRGVANGLRKVGLTVQTSVVYGPPAEVIIDAVRGVEDTMVMMTTHGRRGLARLAMGSVAEVVVRKTAVPVFLVRSLEEQRHALDSIIVPLDGSSTSEAVLPCIEALAPALNANVLLVRTLEHDDMPDATAYLASVAVRLRLAGIREVCTWVTPGPPDKAIEYLAELEQASFIAIATHGRSGLRRWLLGSVAEEVIHTAAVPTLVIRGAGETSLQRTPPDRTQSCGSPARSPGSKLSSASGR
jgi:nucleotide-binding universal stress UspA family protein